MASNKRIRGEQVEIVLVVNGTTTETWRAVMSGKISCKNEIQEENFLGEVAPRFDAIFKGWTMDLELQLENSDGEKFMDSVAAKNQRLESARYDISWTSLYPNGQTTIRIFEDVEFGDFSVDAGGRSDYVKLGTSASCGVAKRVDV